MSATATLRFDGMRLSREQATARLAALGILVTDEPDPDVDSDTEETSQETVGESLPASEDSEAVGDTPEDGEAEETPPSPLDDYTVDELREYAAAHKINLAGATRKADIISAIEGAGAP